MAEKTEETKVPAKVENDELVSTRDKARYLKPAVDIYESAEALTVVADLPGVPQEGVDVRVENNVLTIRGRTKLEAPTERLLHEFSLQSYFRQFELGEQIEQEEIGALLRNGVLTVTLPKRKKAEPRKVLVEVA